MPDNSNNCDDNRTNSTISTNSSNRQHENRVVGLERPTRDSCISVPRGAAIAAALLCRLAVAEAEAEAGADREQEEHTALALWRTAQPRSRRLEVAVEVS